MERDIDRIDGKIIELERILSGKIAGLNETCKILENRIEVLEKAQEPNPQVAIGASKCDTCGREGYCKRNKSFCIIFEQTNGNDWVPKPTPEPVALDRNGTELHVGDEVMYIGIEPHTTWVIDSISSRNIKLMDERAISFAIPSSLILYKRKGAE